MLQLKETNIPVLFYHQLRGSANRVSTAATGLDNGKRQTVTPTESTALNQSPKIIRVDYVGHSYNCTKFGENPSTRGFYGNA